MENNMNKYRISGAIPVVCFAGLATVLTGCMTARDHLLTPHRVTNEVTLPALTNFVYLTNAVVETRIVTNSVAQRADTIYATNWVVSTNIAVLPAHSQTVVFTNSWEPSTAALETAQGLGAAVNVFAPGAGTAVAWGVSGLLSLFAAYQTRKAGNHQAAVDTLGKAIEQARVALQAAGPKGQALASNLTDVIEGHAEAAGTRVAEIVRDVATRIGGDTTAAVGLHAAASVLNRNATAEELLTAAQSGAIPDWFSTAERTAVARIKV